MPSLADTLATALSTSSSPGRPGGSGSLRMGTPYPNVAALPSAPTTPVVTPLGSLYQHVAPIATFQPFTYYDSKAPDRRAYDPTLSDVRPFTFDVLQYRVPVNMVLVVLGYTFGASRFGGVDPLDTLPLEPGRLKTSWFWDITVQGQHTERNTTYNLVPTPIVQDGAGNGLPQAEQQQMVARTPARQTQTVGGAGLAALPFDGTQYGPQDAPFTLVAQQSNIVAIRCQIRRSLRIPLAEINARIDGYLFPVTEFSRFQQLVSPSQSNP